MGDISGEEQFKMYLEFQNEIDETMFLAQQKAELCLGESYIPRKVLLISSRVPKVTLLQCAILPDVITFVYVRTVVTSLSSSLLFHCRILKELHTWN